MKKLSKITESIWSDMQDRSVGKTVRKEDDVNLLDAQGFVEYLRNIYKNVDTEFYIFKDLNDIITVPIVKPEAETKSTWFINYDCNKEEVFIWNHFLNKENKLFDKLNDDYKLSFIRNHFIEYVLVEPKTGKSSNKFFIEIIDYILENASVLYKRILVKNDKITESIWSDMQDRSSGDTVRQEDMITTNKDLKTKIYNLYVKQGEGDTLDVSSLTNAIKCDDFAYIFQGDENVKHIIGLEDWDVSNVKNMEYMFWNCETFNSDLSKWNVSKVTNMTGMFKGCGNFNCDLSKWDVSNVVDMEGMFLDCETFNSDLSKWNVSNVVDMGGMFSYCKFFNSDLSNWNVSSVRNMKLMFNYCDNFNSDLSNWDVSSVGNMKLMFNGCINFDSDLSKWDVSNVENMECMFSDCKSLKQIPSWYHN